MQPILPVVAYIGPETIVPLTSLLAVIGGVALCGWHWVAATCKRCCRSLLGKRDDAAAEDSAEPGTAQ